MTNDGSNVHVCFPCHRDKAVAPSHLCSRHAPGSGSRVEVDFMDPPKDKVEERYKLWRGSGTVIN